MHQSSIVSKLTTIYPEWLCRSIVIQWTITRKCIRGCILKIGLRVLTSIAQQNKPHHHPYVFFDCIVSCSLPFEWSERTSTWLDAVRPATSEPSCSSFSEDESIHWRCLPTSSFPIFDVKAIPNLHPKRRQRISRMPWLIQFKNAVPSCATADCVTSAGIVVSADVSAYEVVPSIKVNTSAISITVVFFIEHLFAKCPFEKSQVLMYNTCTTCGVTTA